VAVASVLCVVAVLAHRLSLDITPPQGQDPTHFVAARTLPAPLVTMLAESTHVAAPARRPVTTTTAEPTPAGGTEPAPTATPRGRYGIEVAAYIFPDRAETERQRLADAGHPVSVVTEWENGAPSYRVVLGPYRGRGTAERTASELLGSGMIQQARVIRLAATP